MGQKIVMFGSFVVDMMARTPHLPTPGETVKGSLFQMGPGGKGFNQAVAAHKAGAEVTAITKLGRDGSAQVALDAMALAVDLAHDAGAKVVLNPAPVQPLGEDLLRKTYLVTPNEVEAEALTGVRISDERCAELAARWFFDRGVRQVIITLGERGAYVDDGARRGILSPYRVKAVDTTGAGDAYNGGLAAALAEGRDLREAARFANALAAVAVHRLGTTPAMPTREEVERFREGQM